MRHRYFSPLWGVLLACGPIQLAAAAGGFVEDIQITRADDEARVIFTLACPIRYQSNVVTAAGTLIELRVLPADSCRSAGAGGRAVSELYRPPTGHLAYLEEVEFEDLGLGDGLLLLRFDRPVRYRVSQWGSLRSLELTIALTDASPVPAVPPSAVEAPPRTSLSLKPAADPIARHYMLNLLSTRDDIDAALIARLPTLPDTTLYVSDVVLNGVLWHRLRLGFFASEDQGAEYPAVRGGFVPQGLDRPCREG